MSNDLNQCNFIGRLGQDPEQRFTAGGDAVTHISLAVGKSWKDKQGQKQERTEWVRVVAFGKLAEIMSEYLKKGSKVFLSGEMKTNKWKDQQGQDRYTTEIVASQMQMLDSRGDDRAAKAVTPASEYGLNPGQQQAPQDDDSSIPF